jgi:hypothetical protein
MHAFSRLEGRWLQRTPVLSLLAHSIRSFSVCLWLVFIDFVFAERKPHYIWLHSSAVSGWTRGEDVALSLNSSTGTAVMPVTERSVVQTSPLQLKSASYRTYTTSDFRDSRALHHKLLDYSRKKQKQSFLTTRLMPRSKQE